MSIETRTQDPTLPRGPFKPETIRGVIDLVRERKPGTWKSAAVTEKQRAYLKRHGVSDELLAYLDRGGAWLLTQVIINQKQEAWAWGFGGKSYDASGEDDWSEDFGSFHE